MVSWRTFLGLEERNPTRQSEIYRTDQDMFYLRDRLADEIDSLEVLGWPMVTELGPSTYLRYDDDVRVTILHDRYNQKGEQNRIKLTVGPVEEDETDYLEEVYNEITDTVDSILE